MITIVEIEKTGPKYYKFTEYELYLIIEALGKSKNWYEQNKDCSDPKIDYKLDRISILRDELKDILEEEQMYVENTIKYM